MVSIVRPILFASTMFLMGWLTSGCATHRSLPQAASVNLKHFMGTWFIHGYTPIVIDKRAHNATESYKLVGERIETTYRFNQGGFDGPEKVFSPVGWVVDHKSNAEWRMQFIWPFRAKYIIMYLNEAGSETIIAHPNRKYAWIMSRSPKMGQTIYEQHVDRLKDEGFDLQRIQRVPHKISEPSKPLGQG